MAQKISYIVGAVVALVGVIGFFNDPVLGIFEVDMIHNLILIVAGLALLGTAAAGEQMAATWAKIVGVVVAVIAVLGFVPPMDSVLGIVETNLASSVLQAVVAVVLLGAGFAGGGGDSSMQDAATQSQQPQQPMGGESQGGQPMNMGGQGGPEQGRQQ